MNNFTMSHMSQFSLPLYIDTCLFFTPAHAKEREKASISKSMQNCVISVMLIFCRNLNFRRFNHVRNSGNNNFYDSFLHGCYRMTRGRHTPTPPALGPLERGGFCSWAMSRPPSRSPRNSNFHIENISTGGY